MKKTVYAVRLAGTDQSFLCDSDDTVLRAALRQGIAAPYECNVGSCGNCKFELMDGAAVSCWSDAPGLSEKDRQRKRWLGCQTRPQGDLQIKLRLNEKYRPLHKPARSSARLVAVRSITHDISEFSFDLAQPMTFASGQYALVQMDAVQGARAYSMSNRGAQTRTLEFQVRHVPNGLGSTALFERLRPGDTVQIDGPFGMAYLREAVARDILCVAGGSGLAPMISVARGAFSSHALQSQRLHFVYGARQADDVCGRDMLERLPGWPARGSYHASISGQAVEHELSDGVLQGYVHDAVDHLYGERLSKMEIYFAGPPLMAQSLLKVLINRQVPMDQVHFDQFY